MAERWVVNASPVILLAKAEVIHFLAPHLVLDAFQNRKGHALDWASPLKRTI